MAIRVRRLLMILMVCVLGLCFSQVSSAYASDKTNNNNSISAKADLDQMTQGITRHLKSNSQGVYFDEKAAIAARENERVILAGRNFNLVVEDQKTNNFNDSPTGEPYTYGVSIPVWGNWCGPGHSGPAAPKDTLDTLCMRHDKCYASRGYFDCACDAQLKAEIDRYAGRMGSKERAMAAAVKLAFSVGLCNPF